MSSTTAAREKQGIETPSSSDNAFVNPSDAEAGERSVAEDEVEGSPRQLHGWKVSKFLSSNMHP